MAYNLEHLVQILEQILHPDLHHQPWVLDPTKKPEVESLLEKARFLKEFLGNSLPASGDGNRMESIESQITDATYTAEDILESLVADQPLSCRWADSSRFMISPPSLQGVIEELDAATEEIMKLVDASKISGSSSSAVSSTHDPNPKKILVGLSEDSVRLKERLAGPQSKLEVIPIVGMGGIGKTTLARNIYDDPFVVSRFDTRAWVTISQDYNIRETLFGVLGCIVGNITDKMLKQKNDQLAVYLHKCLSGRRYVIVLDDMWSNKAWDDLKMFFPDNGNGSRIMVTTRELHVADYAGSKNAHHQMHLLNDDESWNLLHKNVFAEGACPPQLERIGKRIANNCGGLPLAIHVIGGLLSQTERTQASWEQVARDVGSVVADENDHFSKVLSLSYNHLPLHLKPCFLYMGSFPEDYEIRASRLIKLWVAEGFLKPHSDKSLEEVAELHLKALVDRNLISVRQRETNAIVKSYGIHDLLRDLCIRKANQEKFLFVKNHQPQNLPNNILCLRRVCVHPSYRMRDIYSSQELMRLARSFRYVGYASRAILSPMFFSLSLLRVLDVMEIEFQAFPEELLQLIQLRYLSFSCPKDIPSSISKLRHLQTLIIRVISSVSWSADLPSEVLEMPQLRHLKFKDTYVWYDHNLHRKRNFCQEVLQSLSTIEISRFSSEMMFEAIPNLRKLGIFCNAPMSRAVDLTCLCKIENLKCSSYLESKWSVKNFLTSLILPYSLKKLTLEDCTIPLGYLSTIGTLPDLEVLKMRNCILESPVWEPTEGEFCQLQYLQLQKLNLRNWLAVETHFPRLERLFIKECNELEEIPSAIGEISTLEVIEVVKSSPSLVASARRIQEEQLDLGNDGLQVRIVH